MIFVGFVATMSILAALVASVCGFGIGSIITPTLNLKIEMGTAVALVSVPHFVATMIRAAKLKEHIDWAFLKLFGHASAIGSLCGALVASSIPGMFQAITLASLMIFVGSLGLSGKTKNFVIPKKLLLISGAISGLLGGLVGNQGGIRSAAMLSTSLKKEEFIATATACGVIVDLARLPVYFTAKSAELNANIQLITIMTLCCVLGTYLGIPLLKLIPERTFRITVYTVILILGLLVLARFLLGISPK